MAEYRERQNVQIKKQSVYLKQSQVLGKDLWPKNLCQIKMILHISADFSFFLLQLNWVGLSLQPQW